MQKMSSQRWVKLREELLRALRDNTEAPPRRFYDRYFPGIYRYVLCRLDGDHAATEEIVAEVFFQAFRDMEKYDGQHAPGTWLRGIARHRVLDFYRQTRRRPVLELAFSSFDEEFTRRLFDLEAHELPEEALEQTELATVVELVLSGLPEGYEKALRLRYLEDRPVKEIAGLLRFSPKATEARLYRARIAFKEAFRLAYRNLNFEGATA